MHFLLPLAGALAFGVGAVLIKIASRGSSDVTMALLLYLSQLIAIVPFLWFFRAEVQMKLTPVHYGLLLACGVLWVLSDFAIFAAFRHMPTGQVLAISGVYPIVAGLLGVYFLQESLTPMQWFGIILSVAGVFILSFFGADA